MIIFLSFHLRLSQIFFFMLFSQSHHIELWKNHGIGTKRGTQHEGKEVLKQARINLMTTLCDNFAILDCGLYGCRYLLQDRLLGDPRLTAQPRILLSLLPWRFCMHLHV